MIEIAKQNALLVGGCRQVEAAPFLAISFKHMLSTNDIISAARQKFAVAALVEKWKQHSSARVLETLKPLKLPTIVSVIARTYNKRTKHKTVERFKEPYITEPVALLLRIWRPNHRRYDVHNPYVKPIIDGFVHCHLIPDDDVRYITYFGFSFEGVDSTLKHSLRASEKTDRQNLKTGTPPRARRLSTARYRFEFYKYV
jgi:hypothetical protein